ncbi:MAG: glycosyltransferase family 39 protein [Thermoanaerobaculia bacterium]|nr:glycosyltransferase family 39 protein [Thermoanaerobaculia bacterium]
MGQSLRYEGSFHRDDEVAVFRPPGYPFFVATVLWLRDIPSGESHSTNEFDELTVALVQSLLSAAASTLIFLMLSRDLAQSTAISFTLVHIFNPFLVYAVGWANYPTLHVFGIVLSCYLLDRALRSTSSKRSTSTSLLLVSGISWGLTTLVRPMSLLMPLVLLSLLSIRRELGLRDRIRYLAVFLCGMCAVITPYSIRNYALTGEAVLVNAQAGTAIWGSTVEKIEGNFLDWVPLWFEHGMPIYTEITGDEEYDLQVFLARAVELNDRFRKEAAQNIKDNPGTYVHNVVKNIYAFVAHSEEEYIGLFRKNQRAVEPQEGPNSSDHLGVTGESLARLLAVSLTTLGLAGICVSLLRRRLAAQISALTLGMFILAHAFTYLTVRYLYIKYPLLIVLCGHMNHELRNFHTTHLPLRRSAAALGIGLEIALPALAILTTLIMLAVI